jgi:hypothetical protein
MQAMLYYSNTGTFSANIIDNPNFNLFNISIGEFSPQGPSTELFVVVELVGDADPNVVSLDQLAVTTQTAGGPPLRRQTRLLQLSDKGEHFEGFWLNEIKCGVLNITAQINQQAPVHKSVNFTCGE